MSFASYIHGILADGYRANDQESVLAIALAVKQKAETVIKSFDKVSSEQIYFCFRKIEKIRKKHWTHQQDITVYINFCIAIIEDCLQWERIPENLRPDIEETADLLTSLLLCFDSDYSDNDAAELATAAFKTWKVVKF